MGLNWKQWSRNDVLYGIVVPIIVVLVIVAFSAIPSLVGYSSDAAGIVIGIVMEITELTLIVAVPLMLGLVWNRWAGGASGFLMGSFYAIYWRDSFHGIAGGGGVLMAYILGAMLIGFIAGSLNKGSEDFRRMLIAGVIATVIGGVMEFGIFQLSAASVVNGLDGFALTVLPRILMAVIIAVVAKVFFWYGMGAKKP